MTLIFGIKNCDSVKKARKWLDDHQIDHHYHDFRESGLSRDQVISWCDQLDWQVLLNKRSTTWKGLSDEVRDNIDRESAIDAMVSSPTLIKRPVLAIGQQLYVGFKADQYQSIFSLNEE